jgi:hypothetical protein
MSVAHYFPVDGVSGLLERRHEFLDLLTAHQLP